VGKKNQTDSLCWLCGNACGGCSWADEFIPVEGWTAEKTVVYGGQESYNVIACPLFWQPEEGCGIKWQDLDDKGCMRLVERLLEVTRDDYMHGGEVITREVERFLRGTGASRLHMIHDPETVIKALQKAKKQYWARRVSYMKG
jgi:hypothetical protein